MKIIAIHQPEHLPWLGFFNKLLKSDTFVFLDDVQFTKNNWQNRNRIICNGKEHYITVPVEMKGHTERAIKDMLIANKTQPKWSYKYLKTISESYKKHPFYYQIYPTIEQIVNGNSEKLCELNIALITFFAEKLQADCLFIRSSDSDYKGTKGDLIINICQKLKADVYLAGSGGRDYMDLDLFKMNGLMVSFNDYVHPDYNQHGRSEFIPYLSILDLLMNYDPVKSREIILSGLPGVETYNGVQMS